MQAPPIVIDFDVLERLRFGHLPRDEVFAVSSPDLEAVVQVLHRRIVVTVAFLAHAAQQVVIPQQVLRWSAEQY